MCVLRCVVLLLCIMLSHVCFEAHLLSGTICTMWALVGFDVQVDQQMALEGARLVEGFVTALPGTKVRPTVEGPVHCQLLVAYLHGPVVQHLKHNGYNLYYGNTRLDIRGRSVGAYILV